MSHENLIRIEELAECLDQDTDRPTDPAERVVWLEKHRSWLHSIQALVLDEIESTWHEQQVARAEIHGDI